QPLPMTECGAGNVSALPRSVHRKTCGRRNLLFFGSIMRVLCADICAECRRENGETCGPPHGSNCGIHYVGVLSGVWIPRSLRPRRRIERPIHLGVNLVDWFCMNSSTSAMLGIEGCAPVRVTDIPAT